MPEGTRKCRKVPWVFVWGRGGSKGSKGWIKLRIRSGASAFPKGSFIAASLSGRCNLAPVQEYARDVGLKTDLVTMNPSVVQRAFEDLVNATWREKLLQRLHSLNGSILWIPAFMARGGKQRVEWVNELILKHRVNVRTAYPSLRLLHAVRG